MSFLPQVGPDIAKSALIVVDMQNDFLHPDGAFGVLARDHSERRIDKPFLASTRMRHWQMPLRRRVKTTGHSKNNVLMVVSATLLLLAELTLSCASAQAPTALTQTKDSSSVETKKGALEKKASSNDAGDKKPAPASSPLPNLPSGGYVLLPSADVPVSAKKEEAVLLHVVSALAAVAWPLVALIIALVLLKTPEIRSFLDRILRRATQVSVAGLEIKLSEGATATIEDLQKLIAQIPDTHKEWVANSHLEGQFQLVVSGIKKYLTTVECDSGAPLSADDFGRFRFTLHVPDVLLAHSLRQLVNYSGSDRGKRGRLFSVRHGIIGKAWRFENSQFAHKAYSEDELIEQWGMTRPEANDTTGGKNVYLAVFIKSANGIGLAVLYADTNESTLFSLARIGRLSPDEAFKNFEKRVLALSQNHGLIASLEKLEEGRIKLKQFDPYERT